MNLLQTEHVRASDFNKSDSRREIKSISWPISDYGMTDHKIHSRLHNLSVCKILEGVCRNDDTWQHIGRTLASRPWSNSFM